MPLRVKVGDQVVLVPRDVEADGPQAVEDFVAKAVKPAKPKKAQEPSTEE